MAKQRFRDIKHKGVFHAQNTKQIQILPCHHNQNYATSREKLKAFLTDSFMLFMPIVYIVFYLVMGGREEFGAHKAVGWLYILIPLVIIQTIFMYKSGQTPGYRAYDIEVIDENTRKYPSFFIALFRNLTAILSIAMLFGWVLMFFRKDKKNLHDLLSNTAVIKKS